MAMDEVTRKAFTAQSRASLMVAGKLTTDAYQWCFASLRLSFTDGVHCR